MSKENYNFMMPNVNFFGPGVVENVGERAKPVARPWTIVGYNGFYDQMKEVKLKNVQSLKRRLHVL